VDEPTNEFQLQKDENIENEIKTLRFQRVLVGLFIQTYLDFKENGTPEEPVEVIMAKEEWAGDEKDPLNKVLSEFEVTNDTEDYVESGDIQEYLEVNKIDMSMKKFGTLLMKYCAINKCENVKRTDKKLKGKTKKVWLGIKRISETDEEM
jgi:hypothetical protein